MIVLVIKSSVSGQLAWPKEDRETTLLITSISSQKKLNKLQNCRPDPDHYALLADGLGLLGCQLVVAYLTV